MIKTLNFLYERIKFAVSYHLNNINVFNFDGGQFRDQKLCFSRGMLFTRLMELTLSYKRHYDLFSRREI